MAIPADQFRVDIKPAISTLIPVLVGRDISLVSKAQLRLELVVEYDVEAYPIRVPYPKLQLFLSTGARIASLNYVPGTSGWADELASAGRIAYVIDGSSSVFAVINTKHPVRLEWRLTGQFDPANSREITTVRGFLTYTKVDGAAAPAPSVGDCCSQLGLEILYELDNPLYFTEYTWDLGSGDIQTKQIWDSPAKNNHIFTVAYEWGTNGLLNRKTVTRHRDGLQIVSAYAWNPDDGTPISETLASVTRTMGP